jgi:hypothetical protein
LILTPADKKVRFNLYKYILFVVLISITIISSLTYSYRSISTDNINNNNKWNLKISEQSNRVLVIYVFADTHSLSKSNLEYFIRVAVLKTKNVDYYIILQQINDTHVNEKSLPKLPSYAYYIQHENKCFDLGTIGWFILSGKINRNNYKYFIFLNSSVRGPYLVSYYQLNEWYYAFTNRLNDYVKLVGPTISCQTSPHVQSYFWATDNKGLTLLLNDKNIFACHKTQVQTIYNAEIPATQVIFKAGFGIDSLMKKYQGFDFRVNGNRDCFRMQNPTSDKNVDGISLDPFELVFIKLKFSTREFLHVQSRIAAYDKWIQ